LLNAEGEYDVIISEIGGTVGDIESLPYIEAIRQFRFDYGIENCLVIHLTLVPYLKAAGELKTKPTQHSVKSLLQSGIQPDILVCRTDHKLPVEVRNKIARFCNVSVDSVIENVNASVIYEVPFLMAKENLDKVVMRKLGMERKKEPDFSYWKNFISLLKNPTDEVRIGLVGKYVELHDSYLSISESLTLAGPTHEIQVKIEWIHSEDVTSENCERMLGHLDGILVAPGFGSRGIEGKVIAARYAREHRVPYLGICLGMQIAVIEFGRNVLNLRDCFSTEVKGNAKNPVIYLMPAQKEVTQLGGTMRLGSYPCDLKMGSKVRLAYNEAKIEERHRHRYEFNNKYLEKYEKKGMQMVGINPDSGLVEIIELQDHPFFVATQFHPEYKSTVENPHPLFIAFIKAAFRRSLLSEEA